MIHKPGAVSKKLWGITPLGTFVRLKSLHSETDSVFFYNHALSLTSETVIKPDSMKVTRQGSLLMHMSRSALRTS
jgi:hypothetical protein